jgi:choline dehydrogenase-like flavoprotein
MAPLITGSTVKDFLSRKFDYVVVGGGTAGLVVATRLSENPNVSVGVLEGGGSAQGLEMVDIPGNYGLSIGTEYDWKFETAPQIALAGRVIPIPRGKALGGTSMLNFMTWNRPSKEDLDAWRDLGNPGWGWDDVLWVPRVDPNAST